MPIKIPPTRPLPALLILACFVAVLAALTFSMPAPHPVLAADKPGATPASGWDRRAAARYLDDREVYWQGWDHAKKDHMTIE